MGLIGSAALSFPRPGHARTKADLPVVGLLGPPKSDTTAAKDRVVALRKGLQEEGFVEGTNYSLAIRFSEGDSSRMPQLARELGALNPRVIVSVGAGGGLTRFVDLFQSCHWFLPPLPRTRSRSVWYKAMHTRAG